MDRRDVLSDERTLLMDTPFRQEFDVIRHHLVKEVKDQLDRHHEKLVQVMVSIHTMSGIQKKNDGRQDSYDEGSGAVIGEAGGRSAVIECLLQDPDGGLSSYLPQQQQLQQQQQQTEALVGYLGADSGCHTNNASHEEDAQFVYLRSQLNQVRIHVRRKFVTVPQGKVLKWQMT